MSLYEGIKAFEQGRKALGTPEDTLQVEVRF
jgi:hypothetical protein